MIDTQSTPKQKRITVTIAERIADYYTTEDFASNYYEILAEDFHYNRGDIINRARDIIEYSRHWSNKYGFNIYPDREHVEAILDYIDQNIEDFITDLGYYFRDTSLASVAFGEQEEQLSGLYNHRTGKNYNMQYLRRVFDEAGFVVNGDYAYMDLSGEGIHVDLLTGTLPDSIIKPLRDEADRKYKERLEREKRW